MKPTKPQHIIGFSHVEMNPANFLHLLLRATGCPLSETSYSTQCYLSESKMLKITADNGVFIVLSPEQQRNLLEYLTGESKEELLSIVSAERARSIPGGSLELTDEDGEIYLLENEVEAIKVVLSVVAATPSVL